MTGKILKTKRLECLYLIFLTLTIVLIGGIFAAKVGFFTGNSNDLNITFTGNQNFTYKINIFNGANISSATMNLSGYANYSSNLVPDSFNCSGIAWASCLRAFDGSITTGPAMDVDLNVTAVYNFNSNWYDIFNWTFHYYYCTTNADPHYFLVYIMNYSSASEVKIDNLSYGGCGAFGIFANKNYVINYSDYGINDTNNLTIRVTNYGGQSNYEEAILYYEQRTKNPFILLNNTNIWNFSAYFNVTNNKTLDFKNTLNESLKGGSCDCAGCSLDGTNCSINFTFHSDSAGILNVFDLDIQWLEYTKPNLTINSPNETYNAITNIPVSINASDDWQLDYCYFNVTRGASLEVSNAVIANCKNTTFTVSGDATYVIHVYINDTSGNSNSTSATFKTTNYVPPPTSSGPSGGGGVPPTIEAANATAKVQICEKNYPPLLTAWTNFKTEKSWTNFVIVWYAYWDYATCKSAANIIPLDSYLPLSFATK